MKYFLVVPVCAGLIGAALWWFPQDSVRGRAQDVVPEPAVAKEPAPSKNAYAESSAAESKDTLGQAPIVIGPCTLLPIQEQQVSSQLDGVVQTLAVRLGQRVTKGDLLAQLDGQKLRLQVELLRIQATSDAAEKIARALHDEAHAKVQYAEKANTQEARAVPELEYKTYLAQRERFAQEINKAIEERRTAGKELEKAEHLLALHSIRSALDGEVVKTFQKEGETVRQAQPLVRIARLDRLLVEGFCKVQHAARLKVGAAVQVEPELQGAQVAELVGHTRTISSLAMAADGRLMASASEDQTVILWSWPGGRRQAVLTHPAAVHAVVLVPGKDAGHLIVTACDDKTVRVWQYDGQVKGPTFEFKDHAGAVRCLAVSPDGSLCASAGDDHKIALWDLTSGKRLYWLHGLGSAKQTAHQGAVTGLSITDDGHLISSGRDNTLKVWKLGAHSGQLVKTYRDRSGDLHDLGVSAGGKHLLFDHGDELRILERASGLVQGRLESSKNIRFKDFARFSASGRLILAPAADGLVQLWRTPEPQSQSGGFEIRNYRLPRAAEARCGLIAPDEKFFLTGGTDRLVRVWAIPEPAEWEPRSAVFTFVGNEIEPGTDLVRIQAELDNGGSRQPLRPGTLVTLKVTLP